MAIFTLNWRGAAASQVGERIDGYGQHQPIPSLTAITGLLSAALGYAAGDARLDALADSITYAVVVNDPGVPFTDYQTADLTRMPKAAWWHDGSHLGVIEREGSGPALQRRQQWRPLAGGVDMTIVVQTDYLPAADFLTALDRPAFPLYLGRENCPPSCRVAGAELGVETLTDAVSGEPGLVYLPVSEIGWGDQIVSIPSRGRGAQLFAVSDR